MAHHDLKNTSKHLFGGQKFCIIPFLLELTLPFHFLTQNFIQMQCIEKELTIP